MSETSPTGRALLALEVLQNRPGLTAAALGDRLGVSERAARRYVAILREAGVPVESERGRYGGYRLGRGLRLPPLVFSATEALGLVMAALDGAHGVADRTDPVGTALGKIIRALPETVGRPAAMLREHAATVPVNGPRPDPGTTTDLIGAVASGHCVEVGYRSASGHEFTAAVDPWSVVVRHGVWYLLCRAHRSEAVRTYRLERITGVRVLDESFDPPPDLDPVAALEENLARGWGLEVRVAFDAPYQEVRPWIRAPMGTLEPTEDGCLLTGCTSNPQMYAGEWLAGVPHRFRVLGGPELRQAVRDVAARLAAAAG